MTHEHQALIDDALFWRRGCEQKALDVDALQTEVFELRQKLNECLSALEEIRELDQSIRDAERNAPVPRMQLDAPPPVPDQERE